MNRWRAGIYLVLTGIAVFATVWLSVEWLNVGRKDTSRIEVKVKERLLPPHMFFSTFYFGGCGIEKVECVYFVRNTTQQSCDDFITDLPPPGMSLSDLCREADLEPGCNLRKHCSTSYNTSKDTCDTFYKHAWVYMNATKFGEAGMWLRNSALDSVSVLLTPSDNGCQDSPTFRDSMQAIDVQSIYTAPKDLQKVDTTKMSVPVPVGLGSWGFFNFKLSEQQFKNKTVVTTSDMQTSQYTRKLPPTDPTMIMVDVRVASFSVVRNVEVGGSSLVDLMGTVFGWWGVLTGGGV